MAEENITNNSVFVVDIETTGLSGYPKDLILEIGIVELDLDTLRIGITYNEVIGYPLEYLNEDQKNSWIFTHSSLNLDTVLDGVPLEEVAKEVYNLLNNQLVAIYNVEYDYSKFLKFDPFKLNCKLLPCLMKKSTDPCKIPSPYPNSIYKWPTLNEAQEILLEDEKLPTFIDPHRAVSDAYISAKVLKMLILEHNYQITDYIDSSQV